MNLKLCENKDNDHTNTVTSELFNNTTIICILEVIYIHDSCVVEMLDNGVL